MAATDYVLYAMQALLLVAALQDMWKLRISNAIPGAIIGLYLCWLAFAGFQADIWQNAVLFVLVLTVGTLLFARDWLGGGDVKLLAAIALWFDLAGGMALLAYVTIGGGIVALGLILLRRLLPARVREGVGWAGLQVRGPIPYGIAIAAGTILCVHLNGVNPGVGDALTAFMRTRPW